MRINQYLGQATGLGRRAADTAIAGSRVTINDRPAVAGDQVDESDVVKLDGKLLVWQKQAQTIMLNKPVGFVCSRDGQGSKTIYDLLPAKLHNLKSVGRLDKDSSGLLLMTSDGDLAYQLTHPKFAKDKVYEISLGTELTKEDRVQIEQGVKLEDGVSKLRLNGKRKAWMVTMLEGRNRQIRRTFAALGYRVVRLHRTQLGQYQLEHLGSGKYIIL